MKLIEMFNICDRCVYSPAFCGGEPDNCVMYVENNGVLKQLEEDDNEAD